MFPAAKPRAVVPFLMDQAYNGKLPINYKKLEDLKKTCSLHFAQQEMILQRRGGLAYNFPPR